MQKVPIYHDLFSYRKMSVFSEATQKSIYELGVSFQKKAVTAELISNFRHSICDTPAEALPRGSLEIRQIAQINQYYHDQTPSNIGTKFLQAFGFRRANISYLFQEYPDLAWLLMYHGNGYIREAAMRSLSTPPCSPFELAAVVYRMNDWVENVRTASVTYAKKFLPIVHAEVICDSTFFLLPQLTLLNRWEDSALTIVKQSIYRPDVLNKLKERFLEISTSKVGQSLRQILKQSDFDGCLEELAISAKLPTVRAVAVETLLMGRAQWFLRFRREWVDKTYGVTRRVAEFEKRDVKIDFQKTVVLQTAAQDKSHLGHVDKLFIHSRAAMM